MSVTDIEELLVGRLADDPTFCALTGGGPADPRIYWYYQGDAEISGEKPAYVTYALIVDPEIPGAVVSPVYSFAVWGRDLTVVAAVANRITQLFDRQILTTNEDRELWGVRTTNSDTYRGDEQFAGRTLQFRFSWCRCLSR